MEQCIEGLRQRLGEGYNIQLNTILKNNSISMNGVVILKDGAKLTPNIYLDEYYVRYQQGIKLEQVLDEILEVYTTKVQEKNDLEIRFTFEAMKKQIIFRLINRKKNERLLEDCPYVEFLDLAITFYCLVQDNEDSIGTIRITNEHLKLWKVTKEQLCQCAMENTPVLLPPLLRRMDDVLKEILTSENLSMEQQQVQIELERLELESEQTEDAQNMMYILSNTKGINGAACLLYPDVIRNFSRLLQCDLYILPSSIHEIILLPACAGYEKVQLEAMVHEINQTEVPYEEVLSDCVYYYSIKEKKILKL